MGRASAVEDDLPGVGGLGAVRGLLYRLLFVVEHPAGLSVPLRLHAPEVLSPFDAFPQEHRRCGRVGRRGRS
jgi:hypothetical protein